MPIGDPLDRFFYCRERGVFQVRLLAWLEASQSVIKQETNIFSPQQITKQDQILYFSFHAYFRI